MPGVCGYRTCGRQPQPGCLPACPACSTASNPNNPCMSEPIHVPNCARTSLQHTLAVAASSFPPPPKLPRSCSRMVVHSQCAVDDPSCGSTVWQMSVVFGVVQLFFSQMPTLESAWWSSMVGAAMSVMYSTCALGLAGADGGYTAHKAGSRLFEVWLWLLHFGDSAPRVYTCYKHVTSQALTASFESWTLFATSVRPQLYLKHTLPPFCWCHRGDWRLPFCPPSPSRRRPFVHHWSRP